MFIAPINFLEFLQDMVPSLTNTTFSLSSLWPPGRNGLFAREMDLFTLKWWFIPAFSWCWRTHLDTIARTHWRCPVCLRMFICVCNRLVDLTQTKDALRDLLIYFVPLYEHKSLTRLFAASPSCSCIMWKPRISLLVLSLSSPVEKHRASCRRSCYPDVTGSRRTNPLGPSSGSRAIRPELIVTTYHWDVFCSTAPQGAVEGLA